MKKFLLATAAAVLLPTSVFAADLPSRRAPPVFVPPPLPVFSWTGFYLGGNAGYAFDTRNTFTYAAVDPGLAGNIGGLRPAVIGTRSSGFTGGGQIGYNYQLGSAFGFGGGGLVIGAEADAAYTGTGRGAVYPGTGGGIATANGRTDYVGTVRGRIGYAFDNFLVYGTGGFAYGGVRDTSIFYNGAGAPIYAGSRNTIRTGYAYGGGVEYALPTTSFLNFFQSSAVTIKGEFIHYDLGSSTIALPNLAGIDGGYAARIRTSGNLVRAGLNFKFGSVLAQPVVARY